MNNTDVILLAEVRQAAKSGGARAHREASQVSLRDVAAAVGISPSTLSRWERGERRPQGDPAIAWARLLRDLKEA